LDEVYRDAQDSKQVDAHRRTLPSASTPCRPLDYVAFLLQNAMDGRTRLR
jgi:hypothetical protein